MLAGNETSRNYLTGDTDENRGNPGYGTCDRSIDGIGANPVVVVTGSQEPEKE